uniref:Uncharacterized protein n=1 Tax=Anguilla anguilla TaxID=7936 RepID=A0A0E9WS08_ANGAN
MSFINWFYFRGYYTLGCFIFLELKCLVLRLEAALSSLSSFSQNISYVSNSWRPGCH